MKTIGFPMVLYQFRRGWPLMKMQNAVAPTKKLNVGCNFGAGTSRIAVVPARALRVERKLQSLREARRPTAVGMRMLDDGWGLMGHGSWLDG